LAGSELLFSMRLPSPEELAARIDHAVLRPEAGLRELEAAVEELERLNLRCLILSPTLLREARGLTRRCLGAVVGFPFGYHTVESKVKELEDAIGYGADEIDAVTNLQLFIAGRREAYINEARALVEICRENSVKCKLIVDAALVDKSLYREALEALLSATEPDYVKTGTGFGGRPTQPEDVVIAASVIAARGLKGRVRVKAAGGIRTGLQAALLIAAGADVIGTSRPRQLLEDYRSILPLLTSGAH